MSAGVVSSSYAGHALRSDDEEMRHTEEDEEDLLALSGPLDTFSNDLDWDGSYRVISGIHIPRSCNVDVNMKREYRTSLRDQVKVDERTALLPRLSESEEARAPIISADHAPTKSVPDVLAPSPGQSTFSQTVSRPLSAFEVSDVELSFSTPSPLWLVLACFRCRLRSRTQAGSLALCSSSRLASSHAIRMSQSEYL